MAKDPFAKKEVLTFTYPAPMDRKDLDGEALTPTQIENNQSLIDKDEIEEGHWFKIRVAKKRGDVDAVADATQSLTVMGADGFKLEQKIASANREVFTLLAEDWSFDRPCTAENYSELGDWAGDWISSCLAEAVRLGTKRNFPKKTPNSSNEPEHSEKPASQPEPTEPASS